jgi:hypothetical protein
MSWARIKLLRSARLDRAPIYSGRAIKYSQELTFSRGRHNVETNPFRLSNGVNECVLFQEFRACRWSSRWR